jgi:hypothetical protein
MRVAGIAALSFGLTPSGVFAQTGGFGVLGDSASDEYRADDNRGGAYAATTLNWVELLSRFRGFNVGPWGSRDYPRRGGFAFNWARSGATSADVIADGQADGVAAQVAAGQVSTVLLMVGANDFAIFNGTYQQIYNGTLAGQALTNKINAIVANIRQSVEIVQQAGPVTMVVTTLGDRSSTPAFQANFPDPVRRQSVVNAIVAVNTGIRALAVERGAILVDLYNYGATLVQRIDATGALNVGGERISLTEIGDEPHHMLLGDNEHAGTVASGLLANFVLQELIAAGWSVAPFSDQEILENAGILSDTEAPSVSVTGPVQGAEVAGSVLVTANASDNQGVVGVQFMLDGVNLGSEDTSAPYSRTWMTGIPQNGVHTLWAVARDAVGNTSTAPAISVTVRNLDTTPPSVSLTAPSNGAQVVGALTVAASASDNVGVAGVTFSRNGAPLGPEDTQAPYSITVQTDQTMNGVSTLVATARDAAGNVKVSAARTVTIANPVPDMTAPVVSVSSPADGSTVSGTVTISANASDNVRVVGVRFQLDGANLGSEDTSAPFAVTWNTTAASNGPHTLTAVARDAAGNTTSASVSVTVSTPVTTSFSPTAYLVTQGAYQSGTVASLASDDNSYLAVRSAFSGLTSYTGTDFSFSATPSAPSKLDITVVAKATTSTTLRIYAYRVTTSSWVELASFSAGTGEATRSVSITTHPGDYRSADGTVRVMVQGSKLLSSFTISHEMVRLNVTK